MQMGSKEDESERFSHYIHKSFKKTASLIAYTCKAVALLSGATANVQEAAFQYGRNLGIAFQLVDDLLDFVSSQQVCVSSRSACFSSRLTFPLPRPSSLFPLPAPLASSPLASR